jgi:hypothetical protein
VPRASDTWPTRTPATSVMAFCGPGGRIPNVTASRTRTMASSVIGTWTGAFLRRDSDT